MSWTIYKVNVLAAMVTFRYAKDISGMAEFIAKEYDSCIKRGGDIVYGVPVMNGNVTGMASIIKNAFQKGIDSAGENFNLLEEIYPTAFDAYWRGAEMAPIPNPLLTPGGWPSTPPAPGTIANIGPDPISLTLSAAIHKALKETLKKLVDELKQKTVNIPPIGEVNIYETILKIIKKEVVDDKIKNHPIIEQSIEIYKKYEEAIMYSFGFNGYIDCIIGLQENIQNNQLHFAEFTKKNTKNTKNMKNTKNGKKYTFNKYENTKVVGKFKTLK